MEQHQLRLLPVVEETGELLGLISEAHILEAWGEDPFRLVAEVMAGCGIPWEELEEPEEGPRWLELLERERQRQAHGP